MLEDWVAGLTWWTERLMERQHLPLDLGPLLRNGKAFILRIDVESLQCAGFRQWESFELYHRVMEGDYEKQVEDSYPA